MATRFDPSRTLDNLREQPRVRVSIGSTTDVLVLDATADIVPRDEIGDDAVDGYARASGIPPGSPGFTYVRLAPRRVQVWRGREEFAGRTVMRGGAWLE